MNDKIKDIVIEGANENLAFNLVMANVLNSVDIKIGEFSKTKDEMRNVYDEYKEMNLSLSNKLKTWKVDEILNYIDTLPEEKQKLYENALERLINKAVEKEQPTKTIKKSKDKGERV